MIWNKQGLVFNVRANHDWNQSHAQVPVVQNLGEKLRIFYASRNEAGQSNISYVEVVANEPTKVIYEHDQTILNFGPLGSFDDCGLMPSSIIEKDGQILLYYIGWTTRGSVPYQNAIGLAISKDNGKTFKKYSAGPIITVNATEPYFSGTSFVVKENISMYKMWYLSCIKWELSNGKPEPIYNLKYAESDDAFLWKQTGKVAIEINEQEKEGGLVSAAVLRYKNHYFMWYGVRKKKDYRTNPANSYRIGFAVSPDGKEWERKDSNSGIQVSASGWDQEMISYPYIVDQGKYIILFYNGNGFGKSGFGCATLNKTELDEYID